MTTNQIATTQETSDPERHMVTLRPHYRLEKHEDGTTLHIELPGVSRQSLGLAIEGDQVRISGRPRALHADGLRRTVAEFESDVTFEAQFRLPEDVDRDAVAARYDLGVLTLQLPRKRPAIRTIPISN